MANSPLGQVDAVGPAVSPESTFARTPPRPIELREDGYLEKYDAETVFYDACRIGADVVLTCPPLLDLEGRFMEALSQSVPDGVKIEVSNLDRVTIVWLRNYPSNLATLEFNVANWRFLGHIAEERTDDFAGKTVLFTKSKDNDLSWISDWAAYYVANHGVDAILIYDNGSSSYSTEDVLRAISVEGLDIATVVDWPFKFGPQGGKWHGPTYRPWDSDYCEYAIIEHARRKYLNSAYIVIAHDIDELLVVEDGQPLEKVLEGSSADYLTYSGVWVEDVRAETSGTPRFADYMYAESKGSPTTKKWVAQPSKINHATQWCTHIISGCESETNALLKHRHFKGISTNWKWNRSKSKTAPSATQIVDYALLENMENAFGRILDRAPSGAGYLTKDSEAQHQYVCDIVRTLNPARWSDFGMQKQWFWKSSIFVLEFRHAGGQQFGIEIRLQGGRVSLVATSRNDETRIFFEQSLTGQVPSYAKSAKHWEIDWWRPFVAPSEIATSAAIAIDRFLCRYVTHV